MVYGREVRNGDFMGGFEGWEEVDCFPGGVYGG
jgi:hypothetical protein